MELARKAIDKKAEARATQMSAKGLIGFKAKPVSVAAVTKGIEVLVMPYVTGVPKSNTSARIGLGSVDKHYPADSLFVGTCYVIYALIAVSPASLIDVKEDIIQRFNLAWVQNSREGLSL